MSSCCGLEEQFLSATMRCCVWSDDAVRKTKNRRTVIGFDTIKQRRLDDIFVSCYPATRVGHYVPFYFCYRAPMLYVIARGNSELSYHGGQERIVHLVSRIGVAIHQAEGRPWAFTDGNAGARYTQFSNDLEKLDQLVDWNAVQATDWSDPARKERKQAEFLVYQRFPWAGIHEIATINRNVAEEV